MWQGKEVSEHSVAFDANRVEENYNKEYAELRSQITVSNQYNLLLRHLPDEKWHRVNSNEIMRGKDGQFCRICELLSQLIFPIIVLS